MGNLVDKCCYCGRILEPGAVFCVGCGTNLESGEKIVSKVMDVGEKGQTVIKEAEDLGIKEKPKFSLSSIPFLSGKNIFLLLLCMGLTYGFLEYVYPLILYIKYDKVKFALSRGQFDEASIVLAGLENKGKPEFKKIQDKRGVFKRQ